MRYVAGLVVLVAVAVIGCYVYAVVDAIRKYDPGYMHE